MLKRDTLWLIAGVLWWDDWVRQPGLSHRVVPLWVHGPQPQAQGQVVLPQVSAHVQEKGPVVTDTSLYKLWSCCQRKSEEYRKRFWYVCVWYQEQKWVRHVFDMSTKTMQKYAGAKYVTWWVGIGMGWGWVIWHSLTETGNFCFLIWEEGDLAVIRKHDFLQCPLFWPSLTRSTQPLVNVRWDLLDPFLMRTAEADRIFRSNACWPQTFAQTHTSSRPT